MLTDWPTLVMCLDADVSGNLPPAELADLATLLATSLEVSVTAAARPHQPAGRKGSRKGDAGTAEGVQQEATLALMEALPQLLKAHATKPHVVRARAACMLHTWERSTTAGALWRRCLSPPFEGLAAGLTEAQETLAHFAGGGARKGGATPRRRDVHSTAAATALRQPRR